MSTQFPVQPAPVPRALAHDGVPPSTRGGAAARGRAPGDAGSDAAPGNGRAAIVLCEFSGTLVYADATAAEIFGCPSEQLVGRNLADLVVDERNVVSTTLERAGNEEFPFEHPCGAFETIDRDGRHATLYLTLRVPSPTSSFVVAALEDASDCRQCRAATLATARRRAARDTPDLQRELLVHVARGRGLQGISDLLRAHTGRPVLVLGPSREVLAEAGVGGVDRATVSRLQAVLGHTGHGVATWSAGCWSAAIAPEGPVVGWLCILDDDPSADADACWSLEQAVTVVAFELLGIGQAADDKNVEWHDLADQLMRDPGSDRAVVLADILGYDLGRPHWVLAMHRLEGENWTGRAERALRALGVRAPLVTRQNDRLFAMVSATDFPSSEGDGSVRDLATSLRAELGPAVDIGIGGASGREDLAKAAEEAVFALEFDYPLGWNDGVTSFEELGFWQLLADSRDRFALRELVDKWIGDLITHDANQRSELVKTLTTYLNASCAVEATATALSIHRNTLRYRLARIAEITDVDVTDPQQRFNLELACRAWDAIQRLETTELI